MDSQGAAPQGDGGILKGPVKEGFRILSPLRVGDH